MWSEIFELVIMFLKISYRFSLNIYWNNGNGKKLAKTLKLCLFGALTKEINKFNGFLECIKTVEVMLKIFCPSTELLLILELKFINMVAYITLYTCKYVINILKPVKSYLKKILIHLLF